MDKEKKLVPARVDVELIDEVRQVSNKQGWSFAKAIDIAMRRFVTVYKDKDLTTIGIEEMDKAA